MYYIDKSRNVFFTFFLVLVILCSFLGCRRKHDSLKTAPESPLPGVEGTLSDDRTELPVTVSDPNETLPPVQPVLNAMVMAYRNAHSYSDNAELVIRWTRGGKSAVQHIKYAVAYERPNRILIQANDVSINADGKDFRAYIERIPGVIIRRECPEKLTLQDILRDREIYISMTEVRSSFFSSLPPQLLLLLGNNPLLTFLDGAQKNGITMLPAAKLGTCPCYRISVKRSSGEAILWIDQASFILRRIELPTESLRQEFAGVSDQPESLSMTLDFTDAALNVPPGAVNLVISTNTDVLEADSFLPPQLKLLGREVPDVMLTDATGKRFSLKDLRKKTVVMFFWASYASDRAKLTFQQLEKVREKYKSDKNLAFFAVSIDSADVSNKALQDILTRNESTFQLIRDEEGSAMKALHTHSIMTLFILDGKGVLQAFAHDFSPNMAETLSAWLERIQKGHSIYRDVMTAVEKNQRDYEESVARWIEKGVFLDQVELNELQVPEMKVASVSPPLSFHIKELWKNTELKSPGNVVFTPADGTDIPAALWILENGRTVVQLDLSGKCVAKYDLHTEPDEYEIFIITGKDAQGKRYFATYGKRLHIFNDKWKLISAHHDEFLNTQGDISDVVMDDLNADGVPEFYVSFWGRPEVFKVGLDGKLLNKKENIGPVFQMTTMDNPVQDIHSTSPRILLCANQLGNLVALNDRMEEVAVYSLKNRTLSWVTAARLDDNAPEQLAGMALEPVSRYKAVGLSLNGTELWNLEMPEGVYPRPVDHIMPVQLKNSGPMQWLFLGADCSLHLVGADGMLIDRFNYGEIISGISWGLIQGKPVLFVVTPGYVCALEVDWDG